MVDKVARLHFHRASPVGALRALSGWLIALTGLAVVLAHALRSIEGFDAPLGSAIGGGAMAAAATTLGALPLLFVRRISAGMQGMLLGFGAGVMLAASVFSLLLPAFEAARAVVASESSAVTLVALALMLGAGGLLAVDRALPHTHAPDGRRSAAAVWLFVFAIAVHNIPEGLAIGVASGLSASGAGTASAVSAGIAIQNLPEGLIVAIALVAANYSRALALGVAAISGLIEPIAAILGSLMVATSALILPWGLAGAAGAMLFVVSHEIIPESHRRGHETLATGGLMVGFVLMMMINAALG